MAVSRQEQQWRGQVALALLTTLLLVTLAFTPSGYHSSLADWNAFTSGGSPAKSIEEPEATTNWVSVRGDATVYTREDVYEAPPAVLDTHGGADESDLVTRRAVSDARGMYESAVFGWKNESDDRLIKDSDMYVNLVYTRKGYYRSGDIHRCAQINQILYGEAELRRKVVDTNEQVVSHHGPQETIVIEEHVPHLYFFKEDTLMTELWRDRETNESCQYEAWFYAPYRVFVTQTQLSPPPQIVTLPDTVDGEGTVLDTDINYQEDGDQQTVQVPNFVLEDADAFES